METASATIERSLVVDALPASDGSRGTGILATQFVDDAGVPLGPSTLSVRGCKIARARGGGIGIFGSTATIDDSLVEDTLPDGNGEGGVGIAISVHYKGLQIPKLHATRTAVIGARSGGIGSFGAETVLDGVLVRGTLASPVGRFGDGIFVSAFDDSAGTVHAGSAVVSGSLVEGSTRAGIAIFGAPLQLGGSFLSCNEIALDAELVWGGLARERAFSLTDVGRNVCGCNTTLAACSAQSAGLKPTPLPSR